MKRFLSLGALEVDEIRELVALAQRLEERPEPTALAGKVAGLLFFDPSLRTLASMQSAMARLGGSSFVISPGRGSWPLETRSGVVMDGPAAEHVREALPVLAGYADVLAVRAFASLSDLDADLADEPMATFDRLVPGPLVNLESAVDHPCQALGDWKAMDDLGVAGDGKLVVTWANHPKPLPMAVPAAVAEMGGLRGMEVVVLRPEGYAFPPALAERMARAATRGGGSFRESSEREASLAGAAVVYAKSWGSAAYYGDPAAEGEARRALADWCVDEPWFERAPTARFFHCLPVRRNVVVADRVLDGPRSAVVHQAHQRLWAQMAVLHRLLSNEGER